ncbi:hypothetical protein DH2020_045355 [Rehmannia glutinosa]|uniref:Probable magnesium transporter n=1 Tax=Rehmannia glutinosa TaxID=99300 RepID=A0ABR0UEC3_REHGL
MAVSDNTRGLILAMLSSLFIGTSFILKKKGLRRAAEAGTRAGVGGYTYLLEPLWWAGMITMIVGEVANFVAYIYAPAVLVTPLGALSIIVRIYSDCYSAPQEHIPSSVQEVWSLATQPAFLIYVAASLSIVLVLMLHFEPLHGQTNILVYLGICSLMGALTVVSIKAIGIAIKLTLEGSINLDMRRLGTRHFQCGDSFSYILRDVHNPDYYCKRYNVQVLSGTVILHMTREEEPATATGSITWYDGDPSKGVEEAHFIALNNSDYFRPLHRDGLTQQTLDIHAGEDATAVAIHLYELLINRHPRNGQHVASNQNLAHLKITTGSEQ